MTDLQNNNEILTFKLLYPIKYRNLNKILIKELQT